MIDLAAAETLRLNAALAARDASLLHAEATINALTLELAQLRRIRYGAKSEVLNAEQRNLFQVLPAVQTRTIMASIIGGELGR